MILFLLYDFWISHVAVGRWRRRILGEPARGRRDVWADKYFPDARMMRLYPSMEEADRKKVNSRNKRFAEDSRYN